MKDTCLFSFIANIQKKIEKTKFSLIFFKKKFSKLMFKIEKFDLKNKFPTIYKKTGIKNHSNSRSVFFLELRMSVVVGAKTRSL